MTEITFEKSDFNNTEYKNKACCHRTAWRQRCWVSKANNHITPALMFLQYKRKPEIHIF